MQKKKPISFKVPKSQDQVIMVQVDDVPYFYDNLHYHNELQLTAIVKGNGILFAGNNMTTFNVGDVFLIGSNVPHLFKCSNNYYQDHMLGVKGISLFFNVDLLGQPFFEMKEMRGFKHILNESKRVLKIEGPNKIEIFDQIKLATQIYDEALIIAFFQMLLSIIQTDKKYLNSNQFESIITSEESNRLNLVLDYTFQNYNRKITINEIAQVALLSRSQFSYFFKLHTRKTYIQFLNDLRIENACNLLKNKHATVEQICYEVGFKNVSNFMRHFKKNQGVTPSMYRKSWVV